MPDLFTQVNIGDMLHFWQESDFYNKIKRVWHFYIFIFNLYVRRMGRLMVLRAKDNNRLGTQKTVLLDIEWE